MIQFRQTVFICIIFFLFSCNIKTSEHSLPESVGKYGHVLIVIDTAYKNGPVGRIADSLLTQIMYGLPQAEPIFNVNTVPHSGFKDILKRASNIIRINISDNYSADIQLKEDVWAKGQLLIDISADDAETLIKILEKNSSGIPQIIKEKELERWSVHLKNIFKQSLSQKILDSHNLLIVTPEDYYLMESRENDFWIKKEKTIGGHQVIQGMMVYYYPYSSDSAFSSGEMIQNRDSYTYQHIKGMTDSSYMTVYRQYTVSKDTISINGMYAVEYRGLWDMENDFMGGPFLHYTVLDEKNNRIINIDAFVYAPKFKKREYLRELEAIARSLKVNS